MLNVVMLIVIILSVMAPKRYDFTRLHDWEVLGYLGIIFPFLLTSKVIILLLKHDMVPRIDKNEFLVIIFYVYEWMKFAKNRKVVKPTFED